MKLVLVSYPKEQVAEKTINLEQQIKFFTQ